MGIKDVTMKYYPPSQKPNNNDSGAKAQVEALKAQLRKESLQEENKIPIVDNSGQTQLVNDLKWYPDDADYRGQECFQQIPNIDLYKNPCATLNPNNIKLDKSEVAKHKSTITPEIRAYNKKMGAPSPESQLEGENITLDGVVDKSDHKTYLYDDNGKFLKSYRNAVGAKDTPTPEGLRYVTMLGVNPYQSKYASQHPKEKPHLFGPFLFFTRTLASNNGGTEISGVYLHGTNHPESMGQDASIACVRHKNKDITEMAKKKQLEPGDIIKVQQ